MTDWERDPQLERTSIHVPEELRPRRPDRRTYLVRRLKLLLVVLLVIGLVGGGVSFFYLHSRLGDVKRIDAAGLSPALGEMTVLMVGSDSRAELAPGQESHFGSSTQVSGERSDALMILHVDAGGNRASVLSIPRDLYVPIAGTGKSNRINTAYAGGPDQLIATIKSALDISINHYVEVNFDGFRGIVDAVGGLNVFFPAPARDILAELNVPAAGCVHLSGEQGLAYVRSRHYEYQENGRWRTDPTGDIGRINRQQDFIRRMIKKAVSRGVRNPLTANELLNSFVQYVTIDSGMGTVVLARLGANFRSLGAGGVEMFTLPVTNARVGGSAVLRLKQPDAAQVIDRFQNPPEEQPATPAVSPASVKVQVLNGSGRPGEAASAASKLEQAGFLPAGTGDAGAIGSASLIRYGRGAEEKAKLVQGFVVGGAEIRSDSSIKDSDVVLVTGKSFGGIKAPAAAQAPAAPAPAPSVTAEEKAGQPECLA